MLCLIDIVVVAIGIGVSTKVSAFGSVESWGIFNPSRTCSSPSGRRRRWSGALCLEFHLVPLQTQLLAKLIGFVLGSIKSIDIPCQYSIGVGSIDIEGRFQQPAVMSDIKKALNFLEEPLEGQWSFSSLLLSHLNHLFSSYLV